MKHHDLNKISSRELIPGFRGKFIHNEDMTLAYWQIEKGSKLPVHAHHHTQVTQIISGKLALTIGGKELELGPGEVVFIPGNEEHSGIALEDSFAIDIFRPIREDYL